MKISIVIYQAEQLPALKRCLADMSRETVSVVAWGADIEYLLDTAGIAYRSAESCRTVPSLERLLYAEKLTRDIVSDPQMRFYTHRGVPLAQVHALAFQQYLGAFLYHLDFARSFIEQDKPDKVVVLGSERCAFLGDIFAEHLEHMVGDAMTLAGETLGVSVETTLAPGSLRRVYEKYIFLTKRWLNAQHLSLLNTLVALQSRPKPIRLLISDLWRNTSPYLKELPEAEVVLWERSERKAVGAENIQKHRMRFMHADAFRTFAHRYTARKVGKAMRAEWERVRDKITAIHSASFLSVSLRSIVLNAFNHMFEQAGEDVCTIEDTYLMLTTLRPQVVLVRASVSVQTHFAILCHVAKQLGIVSVEVQHGLLYLGGGSFVPYPSAEYIATYGELTNEEYCALGYAREKLLTVGSPRFDQYAKIVADGTPRGEKTQVGYCLSTLTPGWWGDAYDVRTSLGILAEASKKASAHISIAVRPGSPLEAFVRHCVAGLSTDGVSLSISGDPLPKLFARSDVVIAGYSTVLLESILAKKYTVLDCSIPMYDSMKTRAGLPKTLPVPTAKTAEEFATLFARSCLEREAEREQFFNKVSAQYLCDDQSSRRLAEQVRALAKQ
jgi:hypothetical protein